MNEPNNDCKGEINNPWNIDDIDLSETYQLGNYGYQVSYTALDDWGEPYEKRGWEQYYILLENGKFVINDTISNIAFFDTAEQLLDDLGKTEVRWNVDIDRFMRKPKFELGDTIPGTIGNVVSRTRNSNYRWVYCIQFNNGFLTIDEDKIDQSIIDVSSKSNEDNN